MFDALSKEDYNKVQRKCLENLGVVCGISLPDNIKNGIRDSKNTSELFKVLPDCTRYWNWMNIRMLERMAGNCSVAKQLIKTYKSKIFSKKVKDVLSEIPDFEVTKDQYTQVKEKLKKDFDDITIEDITERWNDIEKKFNVEETMLLKSITGGCVEIIWLLRNDLVKQAIQSATKSQPITHDDHPVSHEDQNVTHDDHSGAQDFFPEVFYLDIGGFVIKDGITSMY